MARRRFRDLEDVYDTLVSGGFNIESLPANNKYRRYYEYKTDPERQERGEMPATSRPGQYVNVYVRPFGFGAADNTAYVFGASERAMNRVGAVGNLGSFVKREAPTNVLRNAQIDPAKVILMDKQGGTRVRSEITGQYYRRRTGASFTVPFGRNTATDTEFGTQDAILANEAISGGYQVTFKPERRYFYN